MSPPALPNLIPLDNSCYHEDIPGTGRLAGAADREAAAATGLTRHRLMVLMQCRSCLVSYPSQCLPGAHRYLQALGWGNSEWRAAREQHKLAQATQRFDPGMVSDRQGGWLIPGKQGRPAKELSSKQA